MQVTCKCAEKFLQYSQLSKMVPFVKVVKGKNHELFSQNTPSHMCEKVLNTLMSIYDRWWSIILPSLVVVTHLKLKIIAKLNIRILKTHSNVIP